MTRVNSQEMGSLNLLPWDIVQPIGAFVFALLGWLYKGALDSIKELRQDHTLANNRFNELQVQFAAAQQRIEHIEKQFNQVFDSLRSIENNIADTMKYFRQELDGKKNRGE